MAGPPPAVDIVEAPGVEEPKAKRKITLPSANVPGPFAFDSL